MGVGWVCMHSWVEQKGVLKPNQGTRLCCSVYKEVCFQDPWVVAMCCCSGCEVRNQLSYTGGGQRCLGGE